MKNTFKKIAVSIMATASIAISAVGMVANAETVADSYSIFNWSGSGSYNSVSLTNTSGATRYAQVNVYGYDTYGNYVDHFGKDEKYLGDGETLSADGYIYGAVSFTYGGILYTSTSPVGVPLSSWLKSR